MQHQSILVTEGRDRKVILFFLLFQFNSVCPYEKYLYLLVWLCYFSKIAWLYLNSQAVLLLSYDLLSDEKDDG